VSDDSTRQIAQRAIGDLQKLEEKYARLRKAVEALIASEGLANYPGVTVFPVEAVRSFKAALAEGAE